MNKYLILTGLTLAILGHSSCGDPKNSHTVKQENSIPDKDLEKTYSATEPLSGFLPEGYI